MARPETRRARAVKHGASARVACARLGGVLTTILAIAAAATGLGALIFGAAHQRKASKTLTDIHDVLKSK